MHGSNSSATISSVPCRIDMTSFALPMRCRPISCPKHEIIAGVRAVAATIVEGGLLVLGRNAAGGDGPARGTIFVLNRDRLIPLADVSEGYQHKEAIRQLTLG